MPSFKRRVELPGKSSQELYEKVSSDIARFLEKSSLGGCDIQKDDAARSVTVKHSMFSAALNCQDGFIEVDAKLSLLAAPFKSKLDQGIDRWLEKAFSR